MEKLWSSTPVIPAKAGIQAFRHSCEGRNPGFLSFPRRQESRFVFLFYLIVTWEEKRRVGLLSLSLLVQRKEPKKRPPDAPLNRSERGRGRKELGRFFGFISAVKNLPQTTFRPDPPPLGRRIGDPEDEAQNHLAHGPLPSQGQVCLRFHFLGGLWALCG